MRAVYCNRWDWLEYTSNWSTRFLVWNPKEVEGPYTRNELYNNLIIIWSIISFLLGPLIKILISQGTTQFNRNSIVTPPPGESNSKKPGPPRPCTKVQESTICFRPWGKWDQPTHSRFNKHLRVGLSRNGIWRNLGVEPKIGVPQNGWWK